MITLIIALCAVALLTMAGTQTTAPNDRKAGSDKPAGGPDAKAMELMKPGPEHQQLAKLAGTWDVACKFWMTADGQLTETRGQFVYRSIFEGRYLDGEFTSQMHGQAFTGRSTVGYNRAAKRYESTWYDSMGTSITLLSGPSSDGGKTINYSGEMQCSLDGAVKLRQVETHQSDDRFTLVMYQSKDGKERKTMELTHTRRK